MTMGVKVFYSEISGSKEVKKRQQRVMMILESKCIPYEAIDITEPGKEKEKDFMLSNAKPKGDRKIILSPQIFSDESYCGDYDDFDLANENDTLEQFLGTTKVENPRSLSKENSLERTAGSTTEALTNGDRASKESSVELQTEGNNANASGKEVTPEKDISEQVASRDAEVEEVGEESKAAGAEEESQVTTTVEDPIETEEQDE